jgi:hypothetical protein
VGDLFKPKLGLTHIAISAAFWGEKLMQVGGSSCASACSIDLGRSSVVTLNHRHRSRVKGGNGVVGLDVVHVSYPTFAAEMRWHKHTTLLIL